jgi:P27 family predicted phage terminase small subunit
MVRAPTDLDKAARALWRDVQAALREQRTWTDSDAGALHRYVAAVQTARTMREAAAAQPWTEGSTGQLVPHPAWKVAADADRDAARYAADLLLTPAARKRADLPHGHDVGDSSPFLA